jgi:hypothetical protein
VSDPWADGWVPIPRSLADHPVLDDAVALAVYMRIVFRARYAADGEDTQRAPGHGARLAVGVGQAVVGRSELAAQIRVYGRPAGERAIRDALRRLTRWQLIESQTSNLGTVVTSTAHAVFWGTDRPGRPSNDPSNVQRDVQATIQATSSETSKQRSTNGIRRKREDVENERERPAGALAFAAVEELRSITGRRFDHTGKAILADCAKLAKQGYGVEEVRAVIRAKAPQWHADERMRGQLKPSVLLRLSNFRKYLEEDVRVVVEKPVNGTHASAHPVARVVSPSEAGI